MDKEEAWKWYLKGVEAGDRGTRVRFENLWEEIDEDLGTTEEVEE